ncbi:MAG: TonB-dependent hemoglobin/transferrin/lactoferrin family receptor [Nitratireductor sp.]|nr:TonB-dependent hemoglobin/transferrin/lactoferrin family receptor [Nitratireductor sp.]
MSAITVVGSAFAQDAEPAASPNDRLTVLERIVIGAGTEKVAIDTPQAVSVIEQEDIDREQATMVGEVLREMPGVNTSGSDRMFGQTFNIRGIGAPEAANEEGRIIVNVDGAIKYYEQYRVGGFFSDPELYKRVDVLRGPASSTLYGSGALGGVINFTTKDARDFLEEGESGMLKLKGSYNSNRNGYLGSAILAQRFGDVADLLISGNYRESDPYVTGDGTEIQSSGFETWSGLAKLTLYDGNEGELKLSYQHWDSDAEDQDFAQTGGSLDSGSVNGFGTVDRHVVDRTAVVSYENPFSGNDWLDLKLQASFSDTTVDQTNASGIPGLLTCEGTFLAPYALFCDSEYGYQTWQLKAENTIESRGSNWENFLTLGWQFAHQTRTGEVTEAAGTTTALPYHPEGTDIKNAFYLQDEIIFNERLTIIPGVRWEWHELDPGSSTGVSQGSEDFALSPKIAVHYRINDTLALFGSYAHTERFPTLDEVYSTGGSNTVFLPSFGLKKEQSDNVEAGFALSFYDLLETGDSLQIKTTGFHNSIRDLIDANPATPGGSPFGPPTIYPLPGYINIDNAEIYGVEVEMAYDAEFWFLNAGYSHLVGRNTDTNDYLTTVAPDELALTVGGKLPEQGIKFGWKGRFVSSPQDDCRDSKTAVVCAGDSSQGSTRYAEAFNIHDVFLSWKPMDGQFRDWELHAGVDNIFDTQYKEFLHNEASRGRTFKISLSNKIGW